MRKFDNMDNIVLGIFLLSAIPGGIFISMSKNDNNTETFNDTYFYIGLTFTIIAAICAIIYLVRTGIDLTKPTISNTNIYGVEQISPGWKLFD